MGIPVLIHLLNRRRHRVVKWAAMDFLLKATRESRGRKKLKHIIILCSRALVVMALILAISRPLASNGFLSWGSSKVDTVILILDRSASMEQDSSSAAQSKRQRAIQLAQKALADLGGAKLVLLDSATAQPIQITSPGSLNDIAQTQATDTAANIPHLLNTAVQYALEHDSAKTEIWLASDMQLSNWQPQNGQWSNARAGINTLTEQLSLRIISLNSEPKNNLKVKIHKAQRLADELLLDIEITQDSSTEDTQIPLTLSLNGVQSTETVSLSGDAARLKKRLPLTNKSGFGYIQLPADENPRDNTSYFSYGLDRPILSAVVAPKGESQYYLSLAAAPPNYANLEVSHYQPNQALPWDSLSLVIWQAPLPLGHNRDRMLEFIEKGGIVAFFPPIESTDTAFLESSWGIVNNSSKDKYFIVSDWNRTDGPLRNGDDGSVLSIGKLKSIKRREIYSPTTTLASWSDDSPFLTRTVHGAGAAYFVSSLPDYTWSNLGDADVILPLIQRLVEKGNQRFGAGFTTSIGNLPPSIAIDQSRRKRLDSATTTHPLNQEHEAGIYQFDQRVIAINRAPEEEELESLDSETLDLLFSDTPYSLFEEGSSKDSGSSKQLWRTLLIAMLLFMIIEAYLCLAKKRKST